MKPLVYGLFFCLLGNALLAQTPRALTIADLKTLADCPDPACFGDRVGQWDHAARPPKKGKVDGLAGTQYRYVRPYPNPLFAESTASYWVMSDNSRRVVLTSDNKSWSAGLDKAIGQGGFALVDEKETLDAHIGQYRLDENGVVWHLTWKKPDLFTDTAPHTLTIYHDALPTRTPGTLVAVTPSLPPTTRTAGGDQPHLGGDWDARYPVSNASQLFNAEREYAANYEREHGKVGQTFSRVEKVRIQATFTGRYRPLTEERWSKSFDTALRKTGFDGFANDRAQLYRQEALFDIGNEQVWMPTQEILIKTLDKEAQPGETITLYSVLVSHHDFGGTLHLSFLVNEFASAATTDSSAPKPEPTLTTAKVTESVMTVPPKVVAGCGFNWVPWYKVTAAEKNEMRKVLVMGDDGPNVGLLRFIAGEISQGNRIQIAQHDFFQDGQPGYVVYVEYKTPQYGDKGRVEVFENLGELKLFPPAHVKTTLCAVRPFDNGDAQRRSRGVLGDEGQLAEFSGGVFFERAYAQFLRETRPITPVATVSKADQPEDFKTFIQRFSVDHAFQLSRVKFPLIWTSEENGENFPRKETKANWKHLNVLKAYGTDLKVFVEYPTLKKPTQASVSETCYPDACGYGSGMNFKQVNGLWYCVSRYLNSN